MWAKAGKSIKLQHRPNLSANYSKIGQNLTPAMSLPKVTGPRTKQCTQCVHSIQDD